jgi:hypothetical protein
MEPGLRHGPFALDRGRRDAQRFGRFVDVEPREESKWDRPQRGGGVAMVAATRRGGARLTPTDRCCSATPPELIRCGMAMFDIDGVQPLARPVFSRGRVDQRSRIEPGWVRHPRIVRGDSLRHRRASLAETGMRQISSSSVGRVPMTK